MIGDSRLCSGGIQAIRSFLDKRFKRQRSVKLRARSLWAPACSRWQWVNQHRCRLTWRYREQARSHRGRTALYGISTARRASPRMSTPLSTNFWVRTSMSITGMPFSRRL
ncbi:hypothetical protein F0170_17090 [Pseudomonas sp. MAFF 730085]|uniref:Uncharacterized protein n=1 Tax=Pseudomonas kitaguniensis TaxID=2607908 RepID=A0A5N7JVX8_9PSED|nr:hypothetical protein [Pseudomonas kitaguniensis]